MKIGIVQASSQSARNALIYELTRKHAGDHTVINFGCETDEKAEFSYIEISVLIGMLIAGGAVDFIVTGCSSGQGMMLACNSMPGVLCGYAPTPQDAFLFAQINSGNAVSLPLGLGFGWAGEINLDHTIEALFEKPFGLGYPPEDAVRKQADTALLKQIRKSTQCGITELLDALDPELIRKVLRKENVIRYILENGSNGALNVWIGKHR